jgi:hypothetical protein
MESEMEEESVPTESEEAETPDSGETIEPAPVEGARGAPTVLAALRRFVEGVRDNFTVRTVYGDPIEAEGGQHGWRPACPLDGGRLDRFAAVRRLRLL